MNEGNTRPEQVLSHFGTIVLEAKDHNNPPYQVPNTDTMQYVDANNEDTNRKLDHTSEVRDSHFRSGEASQSTFPCP